MNEDVISRRSFLRSFASNNNAGLSLAASEVRVVTDSLGRVVGIPKNPIAIAPARPAVQEFLLAVAPQKTAALAYKPKMLAPRVREDSKRIEVGALFDRMTKGGDVSLRQSGIDLLVDIEDESDWAIEAASDLESRSGVPLYTARRGVKELPQTLATLGNLLGTPRGEELSRYVSNLLRTLASVFAQVRLGQKPGVLFCNEKLEIDFGRGRRALQKELIELAGGVDLVSDGDPQTLSASSQAALKSSCDVIIAPNIDVAHALLDPDDIRSLPWFSSAAVRCKQICSLNVDGVDERPGMSILLWSVVGLRWLVSVLHPDLFKFDLEAEVSEFFDVFYPS